MNFLANDKLVCPLDQLPLRRSGNSMQCDSGHSFDIARQGYINLLNASDKRSRDPGDSRDMVVARGAFLDGGHYQPLAKKLTEVVRPMMADSLTVVDAGCGEGYYMEELQKSFSSAGASRPDMFGFDISKWAVQAAARRFEATWVVASNRNIPIADGSADLLLSLFGFPAYGSFRSVLKDSGKLLLVCAGANHLLELREIIYPEVNISDSTELGQALAAGFIEVESQTLRYNTEPLNREEIGQLLTMTPHFFRASPEGRERASKLDEFPVTVDVSIHVLQ